MHPALLESLSRLEAHFRQDERCLGFYLLGSIGRGETDAYSDIDAAVVVPDEHYAAVQQELRPLCERLCGPVVVWLPEGESAGFCNYAFLFESGEELLLCDLEIVAEGVFTRNRMSPDRILFDRTGLLQSASRERTAAPFTAQRLAQWIHIYWVYAYLNGKYYRRADLYKLLYVQQTLFQAHFRILNALYADTEWGWWANDIRHAPEETRQSLLVYFGAADAAAVSRALTQEFDLFSADADAACRKWGILYPGDLERAVRRHLTAMGALGSGARADD